jgi:hypothetical protein
MRMSRSFFAAEQRFWPMRMVRQISCTIYVQMTCYLLLLFAGKLANQNWENNRVNDKFYSWQATYTTLIYTGYHTLNVKLIQFITPLNAYIID